MGAGTEGSATTGFIAGTGTGAETVTFSEIAQEAEEQLPPKFNITLKEDE